MLTQYVERAPEQAIRGHGRASRVRLYATAVALGLLWIACAAPRTGPAAVARSYAPVVAALSEYVEAEMRDKRIPGLSLALVDGHEIVWAQGFGLADPGAGTRATAETVYRVGSVSKLFTDMAVMQLVERGAVDLDAPIQTYLPEFAPRNPFGGAITLRQLMSHRSGLVREPPVGHYFDPTQPSLAATVASLNGTELVYAPESRPKYSNAGIAVVGYVLERLSGEPFAATVQRAVLQPLGLEVSAFVPTPEVEQRLARGRMWSYDGREFVAPTFELGMAPAGSLYSSVLDLGRFLSVVFDDGGVVLQPATLAEMLTPQFAAQGARTGFGLGFAIGELAGHTTYGHGGAIYGFATQLQFLEDEQLGVVVCANVDVVNSVTNRIARTALEWMLARREGRPLAPVSLPGPIEPGLAQRLAGRYVHAQDPREVLELEVKAGELFAEQHRERVPVRAHGATLRIDGRLDLGATLALVDADHVRLDEVVYERADLLRPAPSPERFRGLVGEYGWDHNVLFVYEKDGALHALIEWIEIDRLSEVSADVFAFPEKGGLYHGERLVFRRDARGRATSVMAAGIEFERRTIQGEDVQTFTIAPVRPIEELRREARAAEPPAEHGQFRASELVELTTLDPTLRLDIRYATTNNFAQSRFYDSARALLQRPAAEALVRANRKLAEDGYGLLIHDAYRPWYVTKMFWEATPAAQRIFVADPSEGSRHNRGCAVDLTLCDLATGAPVEMVGLYDEMSARSYPDYVGGTALERWHRELLRTALEAEGFRVYEFEWWHFDFQGWEHYRIQNAAFEELVSAGRDASSSTPGAATIDGEVQRLMRREGVQGLALAVIEEGKVARIAAYGRRSVERDLPLTTDTILYGASLTKTAFAYMVLQLVDEGVLDLDASLVDLLPRPLPEYEDYADLADDRRWQALTPRILLTHTSGFANFRWLEEDGRLRFHHAPGSRYGYSGEGFYVLQLVLEEGLGLDVGKEMQTRVFERFGMTHTSMAWRPDFAANLADGYRLDGSMEAHDERSAASAAGSMDTSIADQARLWAGIVRGDGLSAAARAELVRPQVPIHSAHQFPTLRTEIDPRNGEIGLAAGLGLVTFEDSGGPAWFKGGHNDSTGNLVVALENGRRCVVLLANDVRAERLYPEIVRMILGETRMPWSWEYGWLDTTPR